MFVSVFIDFSVLNSYKCKCEMKRYKILIVMENTGKYLSGKKAVNCVQQSTLQTVHLI